ncbi:MAG: cell division protein FtsA [Pseudomonadota bacterium]
MTGRETVGSFGRRRKRAEAAAVLDIGTDKISCFIADLDSIDAFGRVSPHVIGVGCQSSRGVRQGRIVDLEAAEAAIRAAVDAAERMAGVTVREAVVAVGGAHLISRTLGVDMSIAGYGVTDEDVRRLLSHGAAACAPEGTELVHALPMSFGIDGVRGVRDPRGLFGDTLSVAMLGVSAAPGYLQSLIACVERCHLTVCDIVAGPYAAALAVLVEDEMELGAVVLDLGADAAGVAVFDEGALVHVDAVALGGRSVTSDIAQGLSTTLAHAERLKTLHGSALSGPSDHRQFVDLIPVGERGRHQATRAQLSDIIAARLEETFELVRDRLEASGPGFGSHRFVLTGGASQMTGAREIAEQVFRRPVRLGRPVAAEGLAEAASGPAFAVCAGLVQYAAQEDGDAAKVGKPRRSAGAHGPIGAIGDWLRERF